MECGASLQRIGFGDTGDLLYAVAGPGDVLIFDTATGRISEKLAGHDGSIGFAAMRPGTSELYTAGWDNTVRKWNASESLVSVSYQAHADRVQDIAFSKDGSLHASVSLDGTLLLSSPTGPLARYACFSRFGPQRVCFSPDGSYMAADLDEFVPFVIDTKTHRKAAWFTDHAGPIHALDFSPNGKSVISAGWDNVARLWDTNTGEERRAFEGHTGTIMDVHFSPDGSKVLTASGDGTCRIWDASTGQPLQTVSLNGKTILKAAWSSDGSRFAATGYERPAGIFDVNTGQQLAQLAGHKEPITNLVFSADGKRIATTGWDGELHLWDALSGESFGAVSRGNEGCYALTFGQKPEQLFAGTMDGQVKGWLAVPWRLEQLAPNATNWKESFKTYKSRRTPEVFPEVSGEPIPFVVFTTKKVLSERLVRLRNALAERGDAWQDNRLKLAPGPLAEAVARVCLRPDDLLLAMAGVVMSNMASAQNAIDQSLGQLETTDELSGRLRRGTQTYDVTFVCSEPISLQHEVTLTKTEAQQYIEFCRGYIARAIESIVDVNRSSARKQGEPAGNRGDLAGAWLLSERSAEEKQLYVKMCVSPGDHIVAVNAVPITAMRQLQTILGSCERELRELETSTWAFQLERGEFQTSDVIVRLEK
ncbi:MAG: WD40 repeat domain-containing protein, partial [Candidatus Hydrogenedentes bacterium]|nr:WD40 repeat domain-containing protein [Candidatus Hydrogenedentota bacterium]